MSSLSAYCLGFLLPWTWGISSRLLQQSTAAAPYLGQGYLLTVTPPNLECGIAPLGPPAPMQPLLLGCGVAPLGRHLSGMGSSRLLPLTSDVRWLLSAALCVPLQPPAFCAILCVCVSAILDPFNSNQFMLCPWAMSFFEKLCPIFIPKPYIYTGGIYVPPTLHLHLTPKDITNLNHPKSDI